MHLSIAVVMGLPFFSGIMASADAVLVSGATWVAIVGWLRLMLTENPLAMRIRARWAAPRDTAPSLAAQEREVDDEVPAEAAADGAVSDDSEEAVPDEVSSSRETAQAASGTGRSARV